ncbi:hypothetical protein [Romboutsia hominis]|uniref:hypothetical protein n=1 Tax=Romboutsia hominis TaxID=1507512 RepID=UPI000B82F8EC|nr:hypothetical protein [Romboutsia hominis]
MTNLKIQEYQDMSSSILIKGYNKNIASEKSILIENIKDFFLIANTNKINHILYFYEYYDFKDLTEKYDDLIQFAKKYNYTQVLNDIKKDQERLNKLEQNQPNKIIFSFILDTYTYYTYVENMSSDFEHIEERCLDIISKYPDIHEQYNEHLYGDENYDFNDNDWNQANNQLEILLNILKKDDKFKICTNQGLRKARAYQILDSDKTKYKALFKAIDYRLIKLHEHLTKTYYQIQLEKKLNK